MNHLLDGAAAPPNKPQIFEASQNRPPPVLAGMDGAEKGSGAPLEEAAGVPLDGAPAPQHEPLLIEAPPKRPPPVFAGLDSVVEDTGAAPEEAAGFARVGGFNPFILGLSVRKSPCTCSVGDVLVPPEVRRSLSMVVLR